MAQNAPGKDISLMGLMEMFPNDETAEEWFTAVRWEGGEPVCPFCGSERSASIPNRKPMPYRCKDCRKHFSVKHGTVMQSSKLGCRMWAIAVYLLTTGIKGTSSMKLHRDVAVTYKTAWHLAHRIRKAFPGVVEQFAGPVEADETAIGGVEEEQARQQEAASGARLGGQVHRARRPGPRHESGSCGRRRQHGTQWTLQGRVVDATMPTAQVYTDEALAYAGLPRHHEAVQHKTGEYVREQAHTNGIESFWAMLDRGIMGNFHHVSHKHLDRYIGEFAGRHNQRSQDTMAQMQRVAGGMVGKRLRYKELIG